METSVTRRVLSMRQRQVERDGRMQDVYDVRRGETSRILPGMFPDIWPKPIISNFIDVVARDLADVTGIVPSINCESALQVSNASKRFASKRTKIAHNYFDKSNLSTELVTAADRYYTFGFVPFIVEADFEYACPHVIVDDPMGAYYTLDLRGNVTHYAKVWREDVLSLIAKFPQHERVLKGEDSPWGAGGERHELEVIRYIDKQVECLYVPERENLCLAEVPNRLGKVNVVVAERPGLDDETRGQFDDVIWVQLARARMALLGLEAVEKSVGAPLALPMDVQQMSFGGDAIIRTNSPEKVRRVGVELPQAAFAEEQMLERDMRQGARYPEGRSGEMDASVVTGRGVQALQSGFDSQVKTAQNSIGQALSRALSICLEMDEKFWPNRKKEIRGVANGSHFEETYTPSKDIAGVYTVDVTYGFAAGMDPNRALVFLLQLRGDKLVPRDFVQRQLPMDVDVVQLQQQVDNEETTDALKQGVFSMLASMGIMAQQGMDPTMILLQTSKVIELREKGKPFHEAVQEAFAPPPPPEQPEGELSPDASATGLGEGSSPSGLPPGMQASGLPFGIAPGQAEMGQGGRPDMQTLLASLGSAGQANLSAGVARRLPA
jgi:hypothetical protein